MKNIHSATCLLVFTWLMFSAPGKAAQAGVYAANDLLLFFQNPAGTTGTDKVVYFNLGSTFNVFRDAATPGSAAFSSTISLGNINSILTSTYGEDWTSWSSSIFVAANGQNGPTSISATTTSNGDFARTVYITKPRNSVGSVGQADSASPLYPPSQTAVAGQINGANNISTMTQPGAANAGNSAPEPRTLLDDYTPFFNGNPATAYGAINGGLMGSITSSSYTFGSVSNVVRALDLYRVAKTSGTGTANASIWQNSNNIAATLSNDFGVAGGGSAAAFYLGTITLSSDGAVNFVAAGGSNVSDYTAWAEGYPDADLTDKEGDYDKDGFKNVNEYAFGTNPTLGNTALSSATVVSNNLTVGFFRRSTANDQAPAYAVFSSTDLGNAFTNNGASISILTNVAPAGYQAASVTQPVSGSKIFYRIKATLPQDN
jgi:hypothetical protein